jgi:hydrogenase maturation factor HypE
MTINHRTLPSGHRTAQKQWIELGGDIVHVRRTGEIRYLHPAFRESIRTNLRRSDAPAVVLCRINQLLKAAVTRED